jgi:hypothetical protein
MQTTASSALLQKQLFKFLSVTLEYIYISLILIASLLGLIFSRKSGLHHYWLLTIFLFVTFINENICLYVKSNNLGSTYAYYNLYYYFRYPAIVCMFLKLINDKLHKRMSVLFLIYSFVALLLNYLVIYSLMELHIYYHLTGGLFVVWICLSYFYNILKNVHYENPLKAPFFWVATGLFFYFLGILPFFGVFKLLIETNIIVTQQYITLAKSLSILLYSLIMLDLYIQWKRLR